MSHLAHHRPIDVVAPLHFARIALMLASYKNCLTFVHNQFSQKAYDRLIFSKFMHIVYVESMNLQSWIIK